jgi:hypothetical protein
MGTQANQRDREIARDAVERRMHPHFALLRIRYMTGLLILLAVLGAPYVALNVRRLIQGRPWAFTFCRAAKEWEEGERAKRLAARAAGVQPSVRRDPLA